MSQKQCPHLCSLPILIRVHTYLFIMLISTWPFIFYPLSGGNNNVIIMLLATGYAYQMGSSSNSWTASVSGGATSFSTVPQATYLSYSQVAGTTYSLTLSFSATSAVNIQVSYTTSCIMNGYGMPCTNQTFTSSSFTLQQFCPPSTISPPPPPVPFPPGVVFPPSPPPLPPMAIPVTIISVSNIASDTGYASYNCFYLCEFEGVPYMYATADQFIQSV